MTPVPEAPSDPEERMLDRLSQRDAARGRPGPGAAFASSLARIDDRTLAALGFALAVAAWFVIVTMSDPWGRLWGTAQDARCYWEPTLADPYARSSWNEPIAYVYSPAFLQLVSPLTSLPWQAFVGVWAAILLAAVRFLTGPRLLAFGVAFAAMELAGGNISLLLGVAIVVGFRYPAAWAFVLLTKVTPGVGLLWFAVRREWRSLFLALGGTAAIVLTSAVFMPAAWSEWIEVLVRNAGSGRDGTWASLPVPFWIRLPIAVAVVVWGARTDRRWTVPVAAMLALPAVWYGSLSMLLAVLPLRGGSADGRHGEPVTDVEPGGISRQPEPRPAGA